MILRSATKGDTTLLLILQVFVERVLSMKMLKCYGFVRAMRAMDRAEVVLLVIDSTLGLTDQDQRVAGMAADIVAVLWQ